MNDDLLYLIIEKTRKLFKTLYGDCEYLVTEITTTTESDQIIVTTEGDHQKMILFSAEGNLLRFGDITEQ